MSEVKRGLGRGLSSLLGEVAREQPIAGEAPRPHGIQMMGVTSLAPNLAQPRRHFDEASLDELAQSIRQRGLIQPIVVRPGDAGYYQIVAGERRWRAAQRAQLHEVPVIVRHLSDAETFELAIIENIQRQELNAIEEAFAYRRLATDYGHKQEAIAQLVGKSRSHVANMLRLLELPDSVRDAVVNGLLSMGHARALVGAADPAALAEEVIRRSLSVRETEKLARAGKAKRAAEPRAAAPEANADIAMLERQLRDQLGLKVDIAHGAKGGAVTIAYATLDQLDMLCQRLSGESF
jgi:ParB family chromosome partitioning protein